MFSDVDKSSSPVDGAARTSGVRLAVAVVVAVGLGLRALEATSSLWLDELHTLCVASRPTVAELNGLLAHDIHTPLYYLAVHAAYPLVDAPALRWISIAVGLLAAIPLAALARSAGLGGPARVAVVGLFCTLPYQVQWGAELRPYAWLQLVAVLLAWSAFTPSGTRGGRVLRFATFAAATCLGLYSHLFTGLAVLGVGSARLLVRREGWLPLPALVLGGLAGALAFLPWALPAYPWLLEDPGVVARNDPPPSEVAQAGDAGGARPGFDASGERIDAGRYGSLEKLLLVPLRTLAPRLGSLGGASAHVARVALGGLLLTLVALVVLTALRRAPPSRELVGATLAAVVSGVLVTVVCLKVLQRLPLQYFAISAWVWPLVIGAAVQRATPRLRVLACALVVVLSGAGGAAHALGAPREDLERGVEVAVAEARSRGAMLTAVLWQPNFYAHATPYWVYAPDEAWLEPDAVPTVHEPGGRRTLVVLTRGAPDHGVTNRIRWEPLKRGRQRTSVTRIDDAVSVYVYDVRHPGRRPARPR